MLYLDTIRVYMYLEHMQPEHYTLTLKIKHKVKTQIKG